MVAVAVGVCVAVEAVSATNGTKPRCLAVTVGGTGGTVLVAKTVAVDTVSETYGMNSLSTGADVGVGVSAGGGGVEVGGAVGTKSSAAAAFSPADINCPDLEPYSTRHNTIINDQLLTNSSVRWVITPPPRRPST